MHQTHPSTACGTAPPGNNNAQPPGNGAGARQARATRKRRGSTRPGTGAGKSGQTGGGAQAQGARQARRRRGRAGGGGDKRAKARGRAAQRGAHANQRGRAARRRWGAVCVCVLQVVRRWGAGCVCREGLVTRIRERATQRWACYGHTIQNTPDPIRTPKLSWIGLD